MRRNSDEHIRELERRVLAGDTSVSALSALLRARERAGQGIRVLSRPMTAQEIRASVDDDGWVKGVVRIDFGTVVDADNEQFLDLLSNRLTGGELLSDIQYTVLDVDHPSENVDDLLIEVSGDARHILDDDPQEPTIPPGCDQFCLEHDAGRCNGTRWTSGRQCHHFGRMHVNSCVPVARRREIHAARGGRWEPQASPPDEDDGLDGDMPCDDHCGEHSGDCDGNCDHFAHMNQCLSQRRRTEIARLREAP